MNDNAKSNNSMEKERKKINLRAVIAVALTALVILTFFLGYFVRSITEHALGELWNIIKDTSVYAGDLSDDDVAATFVNGVLKEDKYARYYTPAEYAKIREEDKGRYSGVGVGLAESEDGAFVYIAKVYHNSSAHKKGVKEGDRLVAGKFKGETDYTDFAAKAAEYNADKREEEKITVLSVVNQFFAGFTEGDELDIKVMRGDLPLEFTVKKADYTVSYVEYKDNEYYYYFSDEGDGFSGRADDYTLFSDEKITPLSFDTAYIRLHEFAGDAAKQFKDALNFMHSRKKSKLILDLRDNGGGLIDVLLEISSYIINDNGASDIDILSVKEKTASKVYSTPTNRFVGWLTDISVIANTKTASASECLIGALSDYGEREVFGGAAFDIDGRLILTELHANRGKYCTYGKGIMQTTYSLKSGGALKLTTATIFWPISMHSVQDVGVASSSAQNCVADEDAIARANAVLA